MKWYVIQPFYRRWRDLDAALDGLGIPYIHPYHFRVVKSAKNSDAEAGIHAARVTDDYDLNIRPVPVVQMAFIYADDADLARLRTTAYEQGRVLCDRTTRLWRPLSVPTDQLQRFQRALSLNANYDIVEDRPDTFSKGEWVKVVGGDRYVGLEGVICRIKHNRHLIVRIEGLCAIATDYIPQAFVVKRGTPEYEASLASTPVFQLADLAFYLRVLVGQCREQSVGQAQVLTTIRILEDVRQLVSLSPSLATRFDLTIPQVDAILSTLHLAAATADPTDPSMPLTCHTALNLCEELKAHYALV